MPPIAVLVALADPTRCRIVEILRDGPQPVHVVAGAFKISRPAISRHLRVLKQAKLISEKKVGRENRYALHAEKLKPVAEWLAQIREGAISRQATLPAKSPAKRAIPKAAEPSKAAVPAVKTPEPVVVPLFKQPKETTPVPPVSQMGFDF
ncbi:MAG: metalloregulator ArsR/SmtB family transcription factor [Candidatus Devosia phytovorans]|uniref:Metalloregulator ArsR/SmtB family transcription factor n=1 Tax=Candidatus Devosia phytovorans TaxID=3121372 RepID=A0AAJ5VZL6_9HYPH|nr:metalloregulator ArsR/SmtB family transcription factor [Devosia sp.]WEK06394.1 MAG: metalloregulator ArsR/SmtB family transcription factor [Devosia sp.]